VCKLDAARNCGCQTTYEERRQTTVITISRKVVLEGFNVIDMHQDYILIQGREIKQRSCEPLKGLGEECFQGLRASWPVAKNFSKSGNVFAR
jgi:hypothetical protein